MIGRIQGQLVELSDNVLLLDVAGVGYEVEVTGSALAQLPSAGSAVTLHTHFVVREDAQQLYGFASRDERDLFRALIRINGVGPRLALALLSVVTPAVLADAVAHGDTGVLVRVPGVGRKTAERLLVELRGKLDGVLGAAGAVVSAPTVAGAAGAAAEAERALVALGYRPQDASRAIAGVREAGDDAEALVRAALRRLALQQETVP